MRTPRAPHLPLLLILFLAACSARADVARGGGAADTRRGAPPGSALHRTVAALDSALFDAYNRCDLDAFRAFFDDDVEFYHDQGGLTVGSAKVADGVRDNICGKVRRELVPGTLQVHEMRGYGAFALGVHRFLQQRDGRWTEVGEAQFAHLFRHAGGEWRITREISYDHRSLER
ncbi:MAG TPA: nuclear transport factor 2 family protein [Gemmatimonadaceae bacterium]